MFFWLLSGIPFLYILWRVILPVKPFRWRKLAAAALLFLVAFKFQILRRFAGPMFFAPDLPRSFMVVTTWVFVTYLFFFAVLLAVDILRPAAWAVLKLLRLPAEKVVARPGLAATLAMLAVASVLSAWGMVNANKPPEVRHVEICRPDLPPELDGMRIVLLADLHVDKLTRKAEIEEVVRRTNALRPDVIAIAGDFADGKVARIGGKLEPLRELRAKYGVFGVPGNHEYYSGYAEWMEFLRSLGIRMLENEHAPLAEGKLIVAGITDPAAKLRGMETPDVKKALRDAPKNGFRVLLAHQLRDTRNASKHGVDLQLSGHTHGGMVVGLDRAIALLNSGYVAGAYWVRGMTLYVSRGTYLWKGFPIRLGVPSEITCLTLRRK